MRRPGLLLALLLAGCGTLLETADGVAFLEIVHPSVTSLTVGETLQLEARALNARGEPVDVEVRWASADDFLAVDEQTGLVSAVEPGTGGRVQARTGSGSRSLFSDPVVLTVVAPPPPPPPPPSPPPTSPR